jgi:hypothetical protein
MDKLLPFYCLFAHMAVMSHLLILFYKASIRDENMDLVEMLDENQKEIYEEIKMERKRHYCMGLMLGMIVSLLYMSMMKDRSKMSMVCVYVGITTLVANVFYTLMPKSKWMVEYLKNMDQVREWNDIYKKFKYITAYGELLGFFIFVFGSMMK